MMLYPTIARTICILDTDIESNESIITMLAAEEYAVQQPVDWQSALAIIRHSPPEMILLAWDFAGEHVHDFVSRVTRRWPALPIVVLTSEGTPRALLDELEAARLLRKPVTAEALLAELAAGNDLGT